MIWSLGREDFLTIRCGSSAAVLFVGVAVLTSGHKARAGASSARHSAAPVIRFRSAALNAPAHRRCWNRNAASAQSVGEYLQEAFVWLVHRRAKQHHNNDIWDLRANRVRELSAIEHALARGTYRFSPLRRVMTKTGEELDVWCARDALVLKALALCLAKVLPRSTRCTHLKTHGGLKGAVRAVASELSNHRFVLRTDVKSYYASIDHFRLLDRLALYVSDRSVINLVSQYLRRSVERGGCFWDFERGISLGCPLSPLMGAFYLHELDSVMGRAMDRGELFYVRYMDDILVLSRSRWGLRRAICSVNKVLHDLDLSKHPDKTFIGRIDRGFDFLGYHFSRDCEGQTVLSLAPITIAKHQEKLSRLYEQVRRAKTVKTSGMSCWAMHQNRTTISTIIDDYKRRWLAWARGGLGSCGLNLYEQ